MSAPATRQERRFGPSRAELLAALVLLLGTLPLAASSPWLLWLLLVPVVGAVWVVRAGVVVSEDGMRVCNGLAAHRVPWSAVEGFRVSRRGPVLLLRSGARPLPMTAVPRRALPRLREAAQELGSSRG